MFDLADLTRKRTRVWAAGPDTIATFDCDSFTIRLDGKQRELLVAIDTHGRERTVYLEQVQPVAVVMDYDLPGCPDESWMRAVETWRLRRAMYPGQPEKHWS